MASHAHLSPIVKPSQFQPLQRHSHLFCTHLNCVCVDLHGYIVYIIVWQATCTRSVRLTQEGLQHVLRAGTTSHKKQCRPTSVFATAPCKVVSRKPRTCRRIDWQRTPPFRWCWPGIPRPHVPHGQNIYCYPRRRARYAFLHTGSTSFAARALAANVATLTFRPSCIAGDQSLHWFLRIAIHAWHM